MFKGLRSDESLIYYSHGHAGPPKTGPFHPEIPGKITHAEIPCLINAGICQRDTFKVIIKTHNYINYLYCKNINTIFFLLSYELY